MYILRVEGRKVDNWKTFYRYAGAEKKRENLIRCYYVTEPIYIFFMCITNWPPCDVFLNWPDKKMSRLGFEIFFLHLSL